MEKKLEVKNLQISFRTSGGNVKAVRDISFDLYKGETLAIVGESGSGKSVTSKAIIGILAGNSIVEGGEILYDGQDLLKISEEDFHKIRGDKIAMIFQDPMSSLNPIMRIGQQMTEAMILKGKTSQKNARKDFNYKLKLFNETLDIVYPDQIERNKTMCHIFDKFCIISTELEQKYNQAQADLVDLELKVDELLFLISKRQKIKHKNVLSDNLKKLKKVIHPSVITEAEASQTIAKITELLATKFELDEKANEAVVDVLSSIKELCVIASQKDKVNYFTLGYYMLDHPEFSVEGKDVHDLNDMTRRYLDDNFMNEFIALGSEAMLYANRNSAELKTKLLSDSDEILEFFRQEGELDKKVTLEIVKQFGSKVAAVIDRLAIKKKSIEYSFFPAIMHSVNSYFNGVKKNPINQAKYDKLEAKYNRLLESDKKPTWKLVPPALVDLELEKKNIRHVLHVLRASLREDIEYSETYDKMAHMIEVIDYFKELASKVVYKVTRRMAKARALKLLEEVGIPEPAIRYKQYPFQFSGGMRQRIVIAIALSANPDILICDEPTTALDVTIQSQILELINKIKDERKLSVIFITHDLGVVANMADRIAVMYAGKIVEYGTSEDIFYDPRHPYTWALLSSMPDLETKEKLEAIPGTPPNMIFPPKGDAFAERNKYALEIDFELQPPLFEVSDTHFAATWLLHPNAPKVERPRIIEERLERMKKAGADNE